MAGSAQGVPPALPVLSFAPSVTRRGRWARSASPAPEEGECALRKGGNGREAGMAPRFRRAAMGIWQLGGAGSEEVGLVGKRVGFFGGT